METPTVSVALAIEPHLCGPVSVGTVAVVRLLSEQLELPIDSAVGLVDRCVFDGERVVIPVRSEHAAARLIAALQALPPVPRVCGHIAS